jgi:hypothetical protein
LFFFARHFGIGRLLGEAPFCPYNSRSFERPTNCSGCLKTAK